MKGKNPQTSQKSNTGQSKSERIELLSFNQKQIKIYMKWYDQDLTISIEKETQQTDCAT